MIVLDGLTKTYGDVRAVDDLSVVVASGAVTGFLGPNGAGKSTTMRMMLDLDHPTSGTARIDGHRYRDLARPLHEVGALLSAREVHPGRTARAHLLALARSNAIGPRRVDEVLEVVGLADVARRRVGGFSLGMSQRLGIAAALLGDPHTLVLDEPLNGLDPEGVRWVRDLLRGMAAEGRTVLVSSHLMSEMQLTADHLVVIGRGRLVADLSLAEMIATSSASTVEAAVPDAEHRERLRSAVVAAGGSATGDGATVIVEGLAPGHVGDLAFEQQVRLHGLVAREVSLEDAYLTMTAGVEQHGVEPPGAVR